MKEPNNMMLRIKVFLKHLRKKYKTKIRRTNEEYD